MKIGIDLLFVKPQKSGGIESYIRNLLDGFLQYGSEDIEYCLFTSENNHDTFKKYENDNRFELIKCPIDSNKVGKRIIWENLKLDKIAKKNKIDIMFIPVYSKPLITFSNIPYITVIHDLQALHYPQYFSKKKVLWLKVAWKRAARTSKKVIAISNFVKEDIIEQLYVDKNKIDVIYNPIVKCKNIADFKRLSKKMNIQSNGYFYTVSSMLPHKNLKTLLYVIKKIKENNLDICNKLVISGVGGSSQDELIDLIDKLDIKDNIIITGFISNEERDCLYKHANIFLFPSVFEGFGMPPIEAMMHGTTVITTNKSCIPEVTENRCNYVKEYNNTDEWIQQILNSQSEDIKFEFKQYELKSVVDRYLNLITRIVDERN